MPSLNMAIENQIMIEVHWTGTRGAGLTADWNSGERCAVCRHAECYELVMMHVVR